MYQQLVNRIKLILFALKQKLSIGKPKKPKHLVTQSLIWEETEAQNANIQANVNNSTANTQVSVVQVQKKGREEKEKQMVPWLQNNL